MKNQIATLLFLSLITPFGMSGQGIWTRKSDFAGTPRYEFIGYSLNNKGYIGTGTHGSMNSFLADWQEFDPVANTWTQKAPLPMPFLGGVGFAAGNNGYAATGANDATYIFDTYEYNSIGNNWSTKAAFPTARLKGTGISAGNSGYIVGGYDGGAMPMNDCWEYNQPANTWTQRASLPPTASRYYATGFSVNGKVYIFGGTDGAVLFNDLWEFNSATDTWTQKTSLPGEGRQQAMSFVLNNIAYIIGGSPSSGIPSKECWSYNPSSDQWTKLSDFPGTSGISGGAGFSIGGSGYITSGSGTTECWEYIPSTTGMDSRPGAMTLKMYPNPAYDRIHITLPENEKITALEIYSSNGRSILSQSGNSSSGPELNIETLPCGYYILRVKTDSGNIYNTSFIKTIK